MLGAAIVFTFAGPNKLATPLLTKSVAEKNYQGFSSKQFLPRSFHLS